MRFRRTVTAAPAAWGRLSAAAVLVLALAPGRLPARADGPAADAQKAQAQDSAIRDSVVKISVSMRTPDPMRPWTKQSPHDASGTGLVIAGKRILTNAHVVTYASQIFVESQESSDKLVANVAAISPGIDLALLRLDDESFFDKHPPCP